jgi:hypothetical protein
VTGYQRGPKAMAAFFLGPANGLDEPGISEYQTNRHDRTTISMLTIDAVHLREINMPLAFPLKPVSVSPHPPHPAGRDRVRRADRVGRVCRRRAPLLLRREHRHGMDHHRDGAGPRLVGKELVGGGSCPALFRQVRGHRMAKAALENAVWDLRRRRSDAAGRAAGRHRAVYFLRRVHRHPAIAGRADGEDRTGIGSRVPAHQAEVQARLGHEDLRAGAQALAGYSC